MSEPINIVAFMMMPDGCEPYVSIRRDTQTSAHIEPLMTVSQHKRIVARGREGLSNWISAEDELPEEDIHVLARIEEGDAIWIEVCSQHNSFFTGWDHSPLNVTHWMEIPEPPK